MSMTIEKYMTKQAHTIREGESVEHAQEAMARLGVRHLPVLKGGELVGILSDRDINVASGWKGFNSKNTEVSDICSQEVYVTHPDSSLAHVAGEMASKRYGCTVVTGSGDKVVGIFTTTDACRALCEILN